MPNYRIKIEYDGSPFCGWQRQPDQPSVQQAIEEAIHGFCGETVSVVGAGRTDTGVHALGQVANFELSKDWEPNRVREAVNYHLKPHPICLHDAAYADDDFSARFSAKARHYRYRIINRRPPLTFDRGRAWHVKQALDADAMNEAAKHLLGKHDFTTFRHVHCQAKSPVKSLNQLDVERKGEEIFVYASAPSFLHNQVRSFVGSLVRVGDGHWSVSDLKDALEALDRKRCGPVAPSEGLYFVQVDY